MKGRKKKWNALVASLLAAAMVFSTVPVSGADQAAGGAQTSDMQEEETAGRQDPEGAGTQGTDGQEAAGTPDHSTDPPAGETGASDQGLSDGPGGGMTVTEETSPPDSEGVPATGETSAPGSENPPAAGEADGSLPAGDADTAGSGQAPDGTADAAGGLDGQPDAEPSATGDAGVSDGQLPNGLAGDGPDASVQADESDSVKVEITEDSFVHNHSNNNLNNTVQAKGDNAGKLMVGDFRRIFFRLDLSTIKPDREITKAEIVLHRQDAAVYTVKYGKAVSKSENFWTIDTLIASNMPDWTDEGSVITLKLPAQSGSVSVDITDMVKQVVAAGEKTLEIKMDGNDSIKPPVTFSSSRCGNEGEKPYLQVQYKSDAGDVDAAIAKINAFDKTKVSAKEPFVFYTEDQELETAITWETSNPDVLSADGTVNADPQQDTEVTLTAAVSKNGTSGTASITVIVPKAGTPWSGGDGKITDKVTQRWEVLEDAYVDNYTGNNIDKDIQALKNPTELRVGTGKLTFFRLDLKGAKPGRRVDEAKLYLYKTDGNGNTVIYDRASAPTWWKAENLNSVNMPDWEQADGVPAYQAPIAGKDTYISIDVTELVNKALDEGKEELELKMDLTSGSENLSSFRTSRCGESDKVPYFEVTYIPEPTDEAKVDQVIAEIQKLEGMYLSETVNFPFETFKNLESDVNVSWTSDNAAALSIGADGESGTVTQPEQSNAEVGLTAVVSLGAVTKNVTIKVTVLRKQVLSPTAEQSLTALLAFTKDSLDQADQDSEKPGMLDSEKIKSLKALSEKAQKALDEKTSSLYVPYCQAVIAAGKECFSSGKVSDMVATASEDNGGNGDLLEYSVYRAKLDGLVWTAKAQLLVEPGMYTKAAKRALQDQINTAETALKNQTKYPYNRSREFWKPRQDEAIQQAISNKVMTHNYHVGVGDVYGLEPALEWYKKQNIAADSYTTMNISPVYATFVHHYPSEKQTAYGNNIDTLLVGRGINDRVTLFQFDLNQVPDNIVNAQLIFTIKRNGGVITLTHEGNGWDGTTITGKIYEDQYGEGKVASGRVIAEFDPNHNNEQTIKDVTDAAAWQAVGDKKVSFALSPKQGNAVIEIYGNHESVKEEFRPMLAVTFASSQDDKISERYEEIVKLAEDYLAGAKEGSQPGQYPAERLADVRAKVSELKELYNTGNRNVYVLGRALIAAEDALRDARDSRILNTGSNENLFLDQKDIEDIRQKAETIPELKEIKNKLLKMADTYTLDKLQEMYHLTTSDNIDGLNGAGYKVWSEIRNLNFTTPTGTKRAYLEIHLSPENNEAAGCGHAWIDDIEIVPTKSSSLTFPNAGFEDGSTGWTFEAGQNTSGKIDTTGGIYAYTGNGALYLENQTAGATGYWRSDTFDMPEDSYELRYKGKFDDKFTGDGLTVQIHFLDGEGNKAVPDEGKAWITNPKVLGNNTKSTIVANISYASGYQSCALAYMLTGNEDYAKRSFQYMLLFLDDHLQGIEHWFATGARPDGFDYYGAVQEGRNANTLATAYSLIKNAGIFDSDEVKEDFYDKVRLLLCDLQDLRDRTELNADEVSDNSNNWHTDMSIGAAMLGMAFSEQIPDVRQYIDNGRYIVEGQLLRDIREDGSWPESIRYHVAALSKMAVFAKALRHVTGEDWFAPNGTISRMMRFLVEVQAPAYVDGNIDAPTIGDDVLGNGEKFSLLSWYWDEIVKSDPKLGQQMFETWEKAGKPAGGFGAEDNMLQNFFLNPDFEDEYTWNDAYNLNLGSTDYAKYYELYQFRNKYGTGEDTYLAFLAPEKALGHNHYDQLSFSLWYHSTPLVVDPGIESYFSSSKSTYMTTGSHATVQFQKQGVWADLGTESYNRSFSAGKQLDQVQAATDFTANEADEGFTRTIAYAKPGQEFFVIRDQVRNAQYPTRWNLPVSAQEVEIIDEHRVHITGFDGIGMTLFVLEGSEGALASEQIRGAGSLPRKEGNASALVDIIRANGIAGNSQYVAVLIPYAGTQEEAGYEKLDASMEGCSLYKLTIGGEKYLIAVNNAGASWDCALDTVYTQLSDGTRAAGTMTLAAGQMAVLKEGDPLNKEPLESKIKEAKEIVQGNYTDESYAALQAAIRKAEEALLTVSNDSEVAAAVQALQAAIDALKEKDGGTGSTGGSGNTGGSGSSTGGTGSSTGGSGSSTGGTGGSGSGRVPSGQPFLRDQAGRIGWDVNRAESKQAVQGSTIAIDMNGASVVPGDILTGIRGKDITLAFDMGSGITWNVNGKDITSDKVSDIDFSVKTGTGAIPKELLDGTAGSRRHIELSLAHNGAFGFKTELSIRTEIVFKNASGTAAQYTGKYANLFYYNPAVRLLEFVCAGRIAQDGTVRLPFVHASDYTVVISDEPMGSTDDGNTNTDDTKEPESDARAQVGTVKLAMKVYTYNGKVKKPAVIALDTDGRKISGKYYTVAYQKNRNVGTATAKITFKDGYSGTFKKTFTIRPAAVSVKKLTAKSKGFTAVWKKQTKQTSGYQLQYSANAKFKGSSTHSVFVKKSSRTKQTVGRLKAGRKYYVRVRTYKTVKINGKNKKIYSAWSKAGKVRTK